MTSLRKLKILGLMLLAPVLAACETTGFGGAAGLIPKQGPFQALTGSDRAMAAEAINTGLTSRSEKPVNWRNPETGHAGVVRPGEALVAGLSESGTIYVGPGGLNLPNPLETALGNFELTRNANIRLGPSTDFQRIATLDKGTELSGMGRDSKTGWYLMARDGTIVGFVSDTLVKKTRSGMNVLAGGPTVKARYCRTFGQDVTLRDGRRDSVSQTVCRRGNGRWTKASFR